MNLSEIEVKNSSSNCLLGVVKGWRVSYLKQRRLNQHKHVSEVVVVLI